MKKITQKDVDKALEKAREIQDAWGRAREKAWGRAREKAWGRAWDKAWDKARELEKKFKEQEDLK